MTEDPKYCTGCGRQLPLDEHHIVGQAYDSATTPVCTYGCHQFLTRRQLDNGVDLSYDTAKGEVDIDRARALGLNDLLSLAVRRRHPQMVPVAEGFDVCARIGSALLDLSGDPERSGRWLPDPIGARHRLASRCSAVDLPDDAEVPVIGQLLEAVMSQGEWMMMEDSEMAAMHHIAADPEALYQRLARVLDGDDSVSDAFADLPQLLEPFLQRFVAFLLALYEAVSTERVEDLPELMAMAENLAPVFFALHGHF